MTLVEFRNAYYRGWFAARARRPAPEPDMIEEHIFIDMGFAQGKLSSGGPLKLWSKSIEPGMPAKLDIEVRPDYPVFSTRPGQEPSMAGRDEHRPARKYADEEEIVPPAESAAEAFTSGDADVEDKGTLEAQQEKRNPQLPEKKPQYKLPSRPAYSSGKRRAARFAR
ncbi:MAG: hypothetical protein HY067_19150 [Betaproteobacteria bacterium]|nr:hypothetical protein [Betaproteobacteria bacterium]